jgi:hypothetical protein
MPKVKPDIEQHIDNPTYFRNMYGGNQRSYRGGHCGGRGGRGGRHNWHGGNLDNVMGALFGGNAGQNNCPAYKNDYDWKVKKATIVSIPKETLIGKPGETIFANIEIKNNMDWPWKPQSSFLSQFTPSV